VTLDFALQQVATHGESSHETDETLGRIVLGGKLELIGSFAEIREIIRGRQKRHLAIDSGQTGWFAC